MVMVADLDSDFEILSQTRCVGKPDFVVNRTVRADVKLLNLKIWPCCFQAAIGAK